MKNVYWIYIQILCRISKFYRLLEFSYYYNLVFLSEYVGYFK